MKMSPLSFLRIGLLLQIVAAAIADRPPIDRETKQAVEVFNKFGEKVYRHLSRHEGNVFISPLSVSAVVGMIHLGARGNTAQEMNEILELKDTSLNETTLHDAASKLLTLLTPLLQEFDLQIANGVFVNDGLAVNVKYRDDLKKYYGASLYSATFRDQPEDAVSDVNNWVNDETRGKIATLIERPLPPAIPLVIMNAVYFRGNWLHPFKTEDTRKARFFGTQNIKKTDFMYQEESFIHVATDLYQAVELPYRGENVVMVVILPKDTKSLYEIEQGVSYKKVRDELSSVIKQKVKLTLPKFSLNLAYDMRGPLQDVGLNSMFSPMHANLTGISKSPVIALDTIYHKAIVEVNEVGTVAVATTAGINRHSSLVNPEVAEFKADRPFIFIIEDVHSNSILFIGRVSEL